MDKTVLAAAIETANTLSSSRYTESSWNVFKTALEDSKGSYPKNEWVYALWNGQENWYYFNAEGYMANGWLKNNGKTYFLHNVSDDRVHLHNICIRILFKKFTEVFVIAVNTAAFIDLKFWLFVSFPKFNLLGKINVPDIEKTCINGVIDRLFTAHQIILMVDWKMKQPKNVVCMK